MQVNQINKLFNQYRPSFHFRPQELDEAARRRFAKRLYIALPEKEARVEIVRSLLKDMDHCIVDEDLEQVGEITEGGCLLIVNWQLVM